MANQIFYLMTADGAFSIDAPNASEAKRIFRRAFGLKKMPMGSVISTNFNCGFFPDGTEFKHLAA